VSPARTAGLLIFNRADFVFEAPILNETFLKGVNVVVVIGVVAVVIDLFVMVAVVPILSMLPRKNSGENWRLCFPQSSIPI